MSTLRRFHFFKKKWDFTWISPFLPLLSLLPPPCIKKKNSCRSSPKWEMDILLIIDAKRQLQLGFYGIKLWCNLDSRSPGLRLDWNHSEVQSWHSIIPGLFNARRHKDSQPTLQGSPRPAFIIVIIFTIQLGEYITHICLSNRRLEQITAFMCVSPGHCLCRARSKTSALLCREVRFFIAELCSEPVVYTRSSCVYTRACFKQVRTAEDGRTNRHRKRRQQAGLEGACEQRKENTNKYGTYLKRQRHRAQRPRNPRGPQAGFKMKARPLARVKS